MKTLLSAIAFLALNATVSPAHDKGAGCTVKPGLCRHEALAIPARPMNFVSQGTMRSGCGTPALFSLTFFKAIIHGLTVGWRTHLTGLKPLGAHAN